MMASSGPANSDSLLAAAQWIEAVVQGPLAVTLAVLAVAATGLMMLSGRLSVRRGLIVTLGCFVLFGAPAIARGLFSSAIEMAGISDTLATPVIDAAPPAFDPALSPTPPQVADPYAGASVVR